MLRITIREVLWLTVVVAVGRCIERASARKLSAEWQAEKAQLLSEREGAKANTVRNETKEPFSALELDLIGLRPRCAACLVSSLIASSSARSLAVSAQRGKFAI
jgi:hypothetical protein